MYTTSTPLRQMQVVNSASSNLMQVDLDNLDYFQNYHREPSIEASASLFPSSAYKARRPHRLESPEQKKNNYLRDSLRRQVQRNMQLIDAIHKSTDGFSADGGPVLKVVRKQIAMTNREKTLGERAKFYRNKEGRWAFNVKVGQEQAVEQALQDRGLSPEEIKNLANLTEASLQLAHSKKIQNDDSKKHASLPLTQAAMMNQRIINQQSRDTKLRPLPEKNAQPYYASLNSQRSHQTNNSKEELEAPVRKPPNLRTQIFLPRQLPESPTMVGYNNPLSTSLDYNIPQNGALTQRNPGGPARVSPRAGTHAEHYFGQTLRNKPFFSSQINEYNAAKDIHSLNPDPTNLPVFSQYLESVNQSRLKSSERPRAELPLNFSNNLERIPLKTAMIKYRENRQAQALASQGRSRKLNDALKPFSNSALQSRIHLSLPGSPSTNTRTRNTMEAAASKNSSLGRKSVATKKPFFDPSLTYRNPKDLRGVVEIKEIDPRKRIKELYHHYQKKGDYNILSKFLLRRDWLEKPSRLQELKQRSPLRMATTTTAVVKTVKWLE